jgi:hypothetical protein
MGHTLKRSVAREMPKRRSSSTCTRRNAAALDAFNASSADRQLLSQSPARFIQTHAGS